mmetsp:Transcript_10216/g.13330  ORF Transcript_10216/g.13330 Transcript_10216/m.13330 type:complete len:187 (-) Transcript_10216:46-606(-)
MSRSLSTTKEHGKHHVLLTCIIVILWRCHLLLDVEATCLRDQFQTMRTKMKAPDFTNLRYNNNNILTQTPSYQISEYANAYQIEFHLPGVSPKDVNISILDDMSNDNNKFHFINVQGRRSKKSSSLAMMIDGVSGDVTSAAGRIVEYQKLLKVDKDRFNILDLFVEFSSDHETVYLTLPIKKSRNS